MAEETKNVSAEVSAEPTPEVPTAEPQKDTTDYKAEYAKVKAALDKASSDTARYKKELADRSTAEENARREREENERQLRERVEQLENEKRIGAYTTQLVSTIGFDAETASSLADSLPDGVSNDFFAAVKTLISNEVSKAKAEALNIQPKPTSGAPVSAQDVAAAETAKLRSYIGL